MAYLLKFGSYTLPLTLRPSDQNAGQDAAPVARARAAGSATGFPRRDNTTLSVVGELTADTPDALQVIVDDLNAALLERKADLWFGRDDRYYRAAYCKMVSASWQFGITYGLLAAVNISFDVADYPNPVMAGGPVTVALGTAGGTVTAQGKGLGRALPTWTITLSGASGTGPLTLTNTTTGEACQVALSAQFASGSVFVLNADGYTITHNGATNFALLAGRIPTLRPGNNTITLTSGGSATVASLSVAYLPVLP